MPHPSIPAPPHRGGCLCGAVRYSYDAAPLALNACHCVDCQKLTGATHLAMIMGESRAFKHESGEVDRWRKSADSGRQVDIVRCKICGVRMWHEPQAAPEYVFIAAGTLDDQSWFVPTSHIWVSRAAPSATIPEGVPTWPAQPATRQELVDAFFAVHGD
jgi:hypothetical protein